jgi:hypothetical protein
LHRRIFRTRRELDVLRGEVHQLEYLQQSLLRATELLLETTGISAETPPGDGAGAPK